jgi:hypothetical protein
MYQYFELAKGVKQSLDDGVIENLLEKMKRNIDDIVGGEVFHECLDRHVEPLTIDYVSEVRMVQVSRGMRFLGSADFFPTDDTRQVITGSFDLCVCADQRETVELYRVRIEVSLSLPEYSIRKKFTILDYQKERARSDTELSDLVIATICYYRLATSYHLIKGRLSEQIAAAVQLRLQNVKSIDSCLTDQQKLHLDVNQYLEIALELRTLKAQVHRDAE